MRWARSILPDRFEDGRHTKIERGLQAAGYNLSRGYADPTGPRDVLVTWTRHRGYKEDQCRRFESLGGRVLVAEEPHLKGRFPPDGQRLYTLCLSDHQKNWRIGGPERWAGFGIDVLKYKVRPWYQVLVRAQRGIGSSEMGSPQNFAEGVVARLREMYPDRLDSAVRIRPHPKLQGVTSIPLAQDLRDVSCLVTWASHEGTEALIMGVPVVWLAPYGLVRGACGTRLEDAIAPPTPDRLGVLQAMAWSQWRGSEIESGEAIAWTLGRA